MENITTKCDLSKLDPVLAEYGSTPGSLITILQQTQDIYGYLPREALERISGETGTPIATILGVATFYALFRLQPVGKYLIMLCQGTACHVNGSELISAAVTDELGIHDGETTEDGLFTLEHVACLGCCSLSPVMMINGKVYSTLTPDKAKQVLRGLKKEAEEGGAEE